MGITVVERYWRKYCYSSWHKAVRYQPRSTVNPTQPAGSTLFRPAKTKLRFGNERRGPTYRRCSFGGLGRFGLPGRFTPQCGLYRCPRTAESQIGKRCGYMIGLYLSTPPRWTGLSISLLEISRTKLEAYICYAASGHILDRIAFSKDHGRDHPQLSSPGFAERIHVFRHRS